MNTNRFLTILALLCTFILNAQLTKGNWLVGGSGKFQTFKTKSIYDGTERTSKGSSILISPDVGYFFRDKFAVGLTPNFSFSNPSGSNNNSISYGIGPFIRYYFLDIGNKINILSHLGYSYSNSKNDNGTRYNGSTYIFKAGPAIYLNSSVALELTLGYEIIRNKDNSGTESHFNTFGIGAGFQIHLEKK